MSTDISGINLVFRTMVDDFCPFLFSFRGMTSYDLSSLIGEKTQLIVNTDIALSCWCILQGPSIDGSSEILMASSMAARRPFPPSPRRAGPKHSGRRISNLNTT